jgi:nitrogen fixation NifU-like protein
MEIFANPKNVGMIKCADGVGEAEDKVCGDVIKVYFKLEDDVISEVKFKAFGGVTTIASGYALTEIIKGKTLVEVLAFEENDIVEFLEEMPQDKMYSAILAKQALLAAIDDYTKNLEKEMKKIKI